MRRSECIDRTLQIVSYLLPITTNPTSNNKKSNCISCQNKFLGICWIDHQQVLQKERKTKFCPTYDGKQWWWERPLVWEKGGGRQKQSKLFAYNYSTLAALEAIVGVVTYWTTFSGLNWSPLQFIFPLPTCSVWQDFVCSVQSINVWRIFLPVRFSTLNFHLPTC